MLKELRNGNNFIFRLSEETRKVQPMYLTFKKLKMSYKSGQIRSESQKQSMNDFFPG